MSDDCYTSATPVGCSCGASSKLEVIVVMLKDIQDNLAEIEDKLNDLESPYAERD